MSEKKVVVITGGSDGLGKAIAKRLAPNNQVIILSPTEKKLKQVAKELGCDYVVGDVTNYESLEKVVGEVVKKYSRIDCWVNGAGVWIQGALDENSPEKIEEVIKVNYLGVVLGIKAVSKQMKIQKEGTIININSQAGITTAAERSVYYGSKWAVTGFTKSLQPEVSKYGIRVTQIMPGGMKTQMFEKAGNPKDQTNFLDPDEVAKVIEFLLSLDKTTNITEIGIKNIYN